jgi:MFS family permease
MPLALAQISAAFPPERRGWAFGIYSSITALSTVLGPIVGGVVTEGLAWRWIFWVNLPIGLIAAALATARLRETFGARDAIDLPGLVLATGGAFGLVWGLVRASVAGWGSLEILSSLGGGAVLVLLFAAWELRSAQPMIPMRFFKLRAFAAGNAAMFFLTGSLMSAIFFMAQFQQAALGVGPMTAGLRLLPWGVAVILGARAGLSGARRLLRFAPRLLCASYADQVRNLPTRRPRHRVRARRSSGGGGRERADRGRRGLPRRVARRQP